MARCLCQLGVRIERGEGEIAGPLAALATEYSDLSIGSYPFQKNGIYGANIVIRGQDGARVDAAVARVEHDAQRIALGAARRRGDAGRRQVPARVARRARDRGLLVVMDRCMLKEHRAWIAAERTANGEDAASEEIV